MRFRERRNTLPPWETASGRPLATAPRTGVVGEYPVLTSGLTWARYRRPKITPSPRWFPESRWGRWPFLLRGRLQPITTTTPHRTFNKPIYLCVLIVAFVVTIVFIKSHRSARFDSVVAMLASCGLIWGIWTIERPQILLDGYWEGFGDHVALAAIVLLLLFGTVMQPDRFTAPVRLGSGIGDRDFLPLRRCGGDSHF